MEEITFNINIHTNSLLIKGEIPDDFETFELIGKFIDALSKLNKELEIVILFDMIRVPFMFILYLNKIQKTLLKEEVQMQFTIVSKDLELKKFLDGFKENSSLMDNQGMNPFQDVMNTMGAGETALDNIIIPEDLKDKMPEDIQKNIDKINSINTENLQDFGSLDGVSKVSTASASKATKLSPEEQQEMEDINMEELNKIKFIYQP